MDLLWIKVTYVLFILSILIYSVEPSRRQKCALVETKFARNLYNARARECAAKVRKKEANTTFPIIM